MTHVCHRTSDAGAVERVQGAGPARKIMGPLTRFYTGPPYISYPYSPSRILVCIK